MNYNSLPSRPPSQTKPVAGRIVKSKGLYNPNLSQISAKSLNQAPTEEFSHRRASFTRKIELIDENFSLNPMGAQALDENFEGADLSGDELLEYLTQKFNKLLAALREEEQQKKYFQAKLEEQRDKNKENLEGGGLHERIQQLEREVNLYQYEKQKLEKTLEDLRKKIEKRVPVIAEVEKRRLDLEEENQEFRAQVKSLQEQLREALKKNSKLAAQTSSQEKEKKELLGEVCSLKERLASVRKVNQQNEQKLRQMLGGTKKGDLDELWNEKERLAILEQENVELKRNLKQVILQLAEPNGMEPYKRQIVVLEERLKKLTQENVYLVKQVTQLQENAFDCNVQMNDLSKILKEQPKMHSNYFSPLKQNTSNVNVSEGDLRVQLDQQSLEVEIKALSEKSSVQDLDRSHLETTGTKE